VVHGFCGGLYSNLVVKAKIFPCTAKLACSVARVQTTPKVGVVGEELCWPHPSKTMLNNPTAIIMPSAVYLFVLVGLFTIV
jgi:hypothetical protein